MSYLFQIITFFLAISFINTAQADSQSSTDPLVQKTITAWMQKNNIPGVAVEVYENGKSHSYAFGYADRDKKIPVTQNTIFEIGSFTKLFTALILAEEINNNTVQLSDTVSKYLPELASNTNFNAITLQQLATFTGRLPFHKPEEVKTQTDLHNFLIGWKPTAPVGNTWTYSNISIGLLGSALERQSGKPINQLYAEQILKPLHMNMIGINVPKHLLPNYAKGYTIDGKIAPRLVTGLFPAASAAKASGNDMLQFLKASIGLPNTPVKIAKAMRIMQTAYVSTDKSLQGLVWVIYPFASYSKTELLDPPKEMELGPIPAKQIDKPVFNADSLIDKTAATDGFRAYIAVIPSQKSGIVILANRYVSNGEIIKPGREILLNLKAKL
jgi:beta-lactamase class C